MAWFGFAYVALASVWLGLFGFAWIGLIGVDSCGRALVWKWLGLHWPSSALLGVALPGLAFPCLLGFSLALLFLLFGALLKHD